MAVNNGYDPSVVTHVHLASDSASTNHPIAHTAKNSSGNIELLASDCKLNLTSTSEILIKPGAGEGIQIDNELETTPNKKSEITIKTANGSYGKNTTGRTVALKLNTAELTLDTQKAHNAKEDGGSEDTFDREEFNIKFRQDKWDPADNGSMINQGPVKVKLKGRSFDIRCHHHGGIALQIAGHDSDNYENKIKFESDRSSDIHEDSTYVGEGGKGLEFGTFNNQHSSLYTGDYRLKGNAPILAVTRGDLEVTDDKTDYPTQSDDFKDIPLCYKIDTNNEVIIDKCLWDNNTWTPPENFTTLQASLAEIILLVNIIKDGNVSDFSDIKSLLLSLNSALNPSTSEQ